MAKPEFRDRQRIVLLRARSGRALLQNIRGFETLRSQHPEHLTPGQFRLIARLANGLDHYAMLAPLFQTGDRIESEGRLSDAISRLTKGHLAVFAGNCSDTTWREGGSSQAAPIALLFITSDEDPRIESSPTGEQRITLATPTDEAVGPDIGTNVRKAKLPLARAAGSTKKDLEKRLCDAVERGLRKASHPVPEPLSEGEARRALDIFRILQTEPRERKAPLPTVFKCLVLDGLSGEETARKCRCSPATISTRRKTLERRLGIPIERLRSYASSHADFRDAVKGDGPGAEYQEGQEDPGEDLEG